MADGRLTTDCGDRPSKHERHSTQGALQPGVAAHTSRSTSPSWWACGHLELQQQHGSSCWCDGHPQTRGKEGADLPVQCPGDHNYCNLTVGGGGWGHCARPDEAGGPHNPRNLCYVPVCQIWARKLSGGENAVALYNADDVRHNITVQFHVLGWPEATKVELLDVWGNASRGSFSRQFSSAVEPHGVVLLRATLLKTDDGSR